MVGSILKKLPERSLSPDLRSNFGHGLVGHNDDLTRFISQPKLAQTPLTLKSIITYSKVSRSRESPNVWRGCRRKSYGGNRNSPLR